MAEVAALGLRVDGTEGVDRAATALDKLSAAGARAEKSSDGLADAFKGFTTAQNALVSSINKLESSLASIAKGIADNASANKAAVSAINDLTSAQKGMAQSAETTAKSVAAANDEIFGIKESTDAATTGAAGLSDAAKDAAKSTDELSDAAGKADDSVKNLGDETDKTKDKMSTFAKGALALGAALAAAFSVSAIRGYADAWSDMRSVVGSSIGDMGAAAGMMTRLVDIANASYSPLQQTVDVFSRNVVVLRSLGRSSKEAADFTESLNNMLVLTATRGQRAESVQNALSKAMAVGKLQADGLETVLANGGEVAQALAKELGTTVNGLRQLATDGKITGDVIANAIIKPLDDVRARAALMPATIGDAFIRVNTNITEFIGKLDQASGASAAISGVIISFADGIRRAGDYIIAFGVWAKPAFDLVGAGLAYITQYADIALAALVGFAAPAVIGGVALLASAIGVGLVNAVKALTAVLIANPLGLFIASVAAAGYAAYKFRDDIFRIFGVSVVEVFRTAANRFVGSFVAAYELIKAYWSNFPEVIGAVMVGAVNLYIRYVNTLVDTAKSAINTVIDLANEIPGINLSSAGATWGISEVDNPYSDAAMKAANDAVEAAKKAFGKDWLSAAFDGFTLPTTDVFGGGGSGKAPKPTSDGKAAADAAKQNAEALKQLAQSYYLAGINGEELAVAQAKLSLNPLSKKYEQEAAAVELLARGLYQVNEQEKQRQKFGENAKEADKYILGNDNPLSGGAFDNQIARYDAEAVKEQERYDAQLERLTLARELQIATIKSYDELEAAARQQHADRLAQIDQARTSVMLQGAAEGFGALAGLLKKSQGEQSGIYRAMFAVSKAFAIADATLNAYTAISKAWASAPFPANLAAVAATTPQVLAVVSAVSETGLKGMAHSGIDAVPETGTWLLEKGERVTTANTSAKMDAVLERIDSRQRSGVREAPRTGTVVNIIESQERAGQVETRTNQNGEEETDMFVADIYGGGKRARAMQDVYGLRRVGT